MGFDMTYQAVPSDPAWRERIWANKETWQELGIIPLQFSLLKRYPKHPLCPEAAALLAAYPGIENRNCDLGRDWDKLHYLLSGNRRNTHPHSKNFKHAEDIGTIAIRGFQRLNQGIIAGQGVQIRYTPAETILDVVLYLGTVTEADLRRYWDPPAMYEAGVYKIFNPYHEQVQSTDYGEQEFGFALEFFDSLRRFYHEVFEHSEGCLVYLD